MSFSRFIRFNTKLCDPEFMFWYLQHLYASGFMHPYHTQHTGVARLQWTTFSEREPLNLPPFTEDNMMGNGAIFAAVTKDDVQRIELICPPSPLVVAATKHFEPIHSEVAALAKQIQTSAGRATCCCRVCCRSK